MKKNIVLFIMVLLTMASCRTREQVVYMQDIHAGEAVMTQAVNALKLGFGDQLSVKVTSQATPELAMRYNLEMAGSSSTQNPESSRYTIDENGCIDMPGIGRITVAGLTRAEAAARIQTAFRNGVLNDAIVTVGAYNRYVTILGDVARPGQFEINRDNLTLLEAIGRAGDLNITARRDVVKVIRQEGNESKVYYVDLRSKDLLNSPVYNLQQNDVVYVEPNKVKMGQSTNNANAMRSVGTWISIASFLTSVAVLIFK